MNKFTFKGEETNLGRFGIVKSGDVLTLTDKEASDIKEDKRFSALKESDKGTKLVRVKITDKMTPAEKAAAIAENARIDQLEKSNDDGTVMALEIQGKSYDELEAIASQINAKEGKQVIEFDKNTTKPELARQITIYYRS